MSKILWVYPLVKLVVITLSPTLGRPDHAGAESYRRTDLHVAYGAEEEYSPIKGADHKRSNIKITPQVEHCRTFSSLNSIT